MQIGSWIAPKKAYQKKGLTHDNELTRKIDRAQKNRRLAGFRGAAPAPLEGVGLQPIRHGPGKSRRVGAVDGGTVPCPAKGLRRRLTVRDTRAAAFPLAEGVCEM